MKGRERKKKHENGSKTENRKLENILNEMDFRTEVYQQFMRGASLGLLLFGPEDFDSFFSISKRNDNAKTSWGH